MPLDRGVIDLQLQALKEGARWWDQREMRDLPGVLHADERILALARGKVARLRFLRRSWLIVVTDQRLLCIRSVGRTWRQLEVPAHQMTHVALRVGVFKGRVLISAGGHRYRLLVPRPDAYKLMIALSRLVKRPHETMPGFGPTRMVRRMMDHMLALPAVAFNPGSQAPPPLPSPELAAAEDRVHALEDEVQELRRQVEFLEQLLRDRHEAPVGER